MRRSSVVFVAALMLLTALPVAAATPTDSFAGSWTAYDPSPPAGDGSLMTLKIQVRGDQVRVQLIDTLASAACDPAARALLRGKATIRTDRMRVWFTSVKCDGANPTITEARMVFRAMPDGTLVDNFGIVWSRP